MVRGWDVSVEQSLFLFFGACRKEGKTSCCRTVDYCGVVRLSRWFDTVGCHLHTLAQLDCCFFGGERCSIHGAWTLACGEKIRSKEATLARLSCVCGCDDRSRLQRLRLWWTEYTPSVARDRFNPWFPCWDVSACTQARGWVSLVCPHARVMRFVVLRSAFAVARRATSCLAYVHC